jgi:hypothetical protein
LIGGFREWAGLRECNWGYGNGRDRKLGSDGIRKWDGWMNGWTKDDGRRMRDDG